MELKLAKNVFGSIVEVQLVGFATDHKTYFMCIYYQQPSTYVVWFENYGMIKFFVDLDAHVNGQKLLKKSVKTINCGSRVYTFNTNNIYRVITRAFPNDDVTWF
jgi:hypothetical protein